VNKHILLSFDVEEYDMPLEYGGSISFEQQMAISTEGVQAVMALLKQYNIKATFYTTAQYAIHKPDIIQQLVADEHEIASHGYYHSRFEEADLATSRRTLMHISGKNVYGYRMPRMQAVSNQALKEAGYLYNSSLNPTWLPGHYNHFRKPRTYFYTNELLQLPASVTPVLRIPLFWLSFHNFPENIYRYLCTCVMRKDTYCNMYFHPWEFTDIRKNTNAKYPTYITKNTGQYMKNRLEQFIMWAFRKNYMFISTANWLAQKKLIKI